MSKTTTQLKSSLRVIDLRWLIGFVGLGLIVGGVAWINGRPVLALLNRVGVDWSGAETPDDIQQRYLARAGDEAKKIQSVDLAAYLYLNFLDGQDANPNAATLWSQVLAADPDNAVGPYLQAVYASGLGGAAERYAAMSGHLQAATDRPAARWYVGASRNHWEKALQASGTKELQTVTRAILIVGYRKGRALREGGLALCRLSRALADENALDSSAECASHAGRWARLSVQGDATPQIAMAAAEVLAEADGLSALFAAQRGDLAAANPYRESAERARDFRELYRRSTEGYPIDVLMAGAPRSTRPTAFLMMLRSLISVGIPLTCGGVAAVTLIFAFLGWIWSRRGSNDSPELIAYSRFWFWCATAGAISFPGCLGIASLQFSPVEEIFLGSAYWIGATLAWVGVATLWVVCGAARWWAGRSTGESSVSVRVWYVAGLLLALLWVSMLLTQWDFFGPNETGFDAGHQLDRAVLKHRTWASFLAVVTGLAGVVWCFVAWREFHQADPARRSALLRLRIASLKALMLLSGLGFAIGVFGTVLAERTYYRYEGRYRALVADDLRDEVSARIGPGWQARYFATPNNR